MPTLEYYHLKKLILLYEESRMNLLTVTIWIAVVTTVYTLTTLIILFFIIKQVKELTKTRKLEAYKQAMEHLIEMKHDYMADPQRAQEVLEPSSHFQKAKGNLSPGPFMCVCKSFFHLEHICLLRYNGEITDDKEWEGLANGMWPYLNLDAFRKVYELHLKPDKTHHPAFLEVLKEYYETPGRDPWNFPDPLKVTDSRINL
ncbi:hypothetical protein HYR99_30425 [Candidatus Poribacteria bacterium]|nr:hypothetical protein [Candidatus Poribacteria bacterium]